MIGNGSQPEPLQQSISNTTQNKRKSLFALKLFLRAEQFLHFLLGNLVFRTFCFALCYFGFCLGCAWSVTTMGVTAINNSQ
jgi:hypothetical protein